MEKKDRFFVGSIFVLTALCGWFFNLDYSNIAESGLTLASIVLAVYIAAIIGLINTALAQRMQHTVVGARKDKTQLGLLTTYFKYAITFSILTILLSSLVLLIPPPPSLNYAIILWRILSVAGLSVYMENLVFLVIVVRFILNRQIWNK